MSKQFEGKVAVITGAGSGIGRAISLRLADHGATVVGVDRDQAGLAETASQAATVMTTIVADLADPAGCSAVIDRAVEEHGRLDVLGNVAGIASIEHMRDVTVEQYRRLMGVNTDACFFLGQAAMGHLIASSGALISIASSAGLVGQAYTVAYCMSKAAVIAMTKAMAMEFMKTNVRINAIAPGGVLTPLVQNYSVPDGLDQDLFTRYHAIRGIGEPDDIASLFAFLASAEASNIHGAIISSDRGATAG